ncbi:hypothetical protein [Nocardia iowensis]|uniref:DNA ligase (ATP) n=1 Tax=Nocardia iowensis TaxID=204891 RepID=A0ABX8RIV0_NOCIO|nr:hypothetical protein [Nocardia iowensis]QXN88802.1 hypothetical protein KV110_24825 [Nocardia iowensis]
MSSALDGSWDGRAFAAAGRRLHRHARNRSWVKTAIRRFADALIIGWLPGTGAHADSFGALILAGHDAQGYLNYIGCIGTGCTMKTRQILGATLDQIALTHPAIAGPISREILRAGHFVEPILVADIAYRNSADGSLRHPSFRGIKPDVRLKPSNCPLQTADQLALATHHIAD